MKTVAYFENYITFRTNLSCCLLKMFFKYIIKLTHPSVFEHINLIQMMSKINEIQCLPFRLKRRRAENRRYAMTAGEFSNHAVENPAYEHGLHTGEAVTIENLYHHAGPSEHPYELTMHTEGLDDGLPKPTFTSFTGVDINPPDVNTSDA